METLTDPEANNLIAQLSATKDKKVSIGGHHRKNNWPLSVGEGEIILIKPTIANHPATAQIKTGPLFTKFKKLHNQSR
ncbi:MAG: hypothetical protein ACPGN3_08425 [Opitutales bacterium]